MDSLSSISLNAPRQGFSKSSRSQKTCINSYKGEDIVLSLCIWYLGFDFIALMRSCLDFGMRNFTHPNHLPFPTTFSFLFNFHYCPLPFALPPWQGFSCFPHTHSFCLALSLSKYGHGGSVLYSRWSFKAPTGCYCHYRNYENQVQLCNQQQFGILNAALKSLMMTTLQSSFVLNVQCILMATSQAQCHRFMKELVKNINK